ncbi:MAG: type I restriction endonuclease [Rhodonellum sp.]|nr:type I restriction endonuclease [Rhodonellum sp.]MDO9553367.1 type I restriction endonuclease [Rhodonellum sp.]
MNPETTREDLLRLLDEISLELDYEDLGKKFYERLTSNSVVKLIDFTNPERNSFHVTTELTCKSGDDIILPEIETRG